VVKAIIANFKAGARKAGKNPEKMPKQVEITVAYTDDVDAVVKIFKRY
jgi:coenzyme F420-dependent glucose-6-phosphate dehydrogenase